MPQNLTIPLQTTRKENNCKTKEKLERAVVTVETERIKGSNPLCLTLGRESGRRHAPAAVSSGKEPLARIG